MAVDRRELIVEAASRSFALFGYKATTMDQVARIANVGKGTIYNFFSNKEELFQEILNRFIQKLKRIAEGAMNPQLSFFDNLGVVLERLLAFIREDELAMKLSQEVREISTQMAQEGIRQMEQAIRGYISEQVRLAVDKGQLRPCNPELTALVIIKLFVALTADWNKTHEPLDKVEVAGLFRFYLQDGLLPERAG